MRKPLFLDRDGVLNVDITPYVSNIKLLRICPYTVDALELLDQAGFEFYVVSNQQGVSKGITPPEQLNLIRNGIQDACGDRGVERRKSY